MTPQFPDDLRPSTSGRLLRRALLALNTTPARIVLTLLVLLVLFVLLGAFRLLPAA